MNFNLLLQRFPEYQNPQESLNLNLQSQVTLNDINDCLELGGKFDLNMIRGDPATLITEIDSPRSSSSFNQNELPEPETNTSTSCYAVGHFLSTKPSTVHSTVFEENFHDPPNEEVLNQIILSGKDEIRTAKDHRRVPSIKSENVIKIDESYSKLFLI